MYPDGTQVLGSTSKWPYEVGYANVRIEINISLKYISFYSHRKLKPGWGEIWPTLIVEKEFSSWIFLAGTCHSNCNIFRCIQHKQKSRNLVYGVGKLSFTTLCCLWYFDRREYLCRCQRVTDKFCLILPIKQLSIWDK